jgi:predicted AAA+ superfamily ATPase
MWINRDISAQIELDTSVVQVLLGPRQIGKSSLFLHDNKSFTEISFDDSALRDLAAQDPAMFLDQYQGQKLLIDEAHLVPGVFSAIKRKVDLWKRKEIKNETLFRLTGSNQILIDRNIKESLAGRASYFFLNSLSVAEISNHFDFSIFEIMYRGGFPEIYSNELSPKKFLDNYISTYLERDVVLAAGISKAPDFIKLCRLLASRVGQLLNYSELAKNIGVEANTVKAWIHSLQRMGIVYLLEPYANNLSKRLIKSPKIYFWDSGIACRLQGWSDYLPILTSPQAGFLFENMVLAEIVKLKTNFGLDFDIFHWRTKDQEEVDFVLMPHLATKEPLLIECKVSSQSPPSLASLKQISIELRNRSPQLICCHVEGAAAGHGRVPIKKLASHILQWAHS